MDDFLVVVRWIKLVILSGRTQRVLKPEPIQLRMMFYKVIYFGYPNQLSSGIMEKFILENRLCMGSFLIVIPETT